MQMCVQIFVAALFFYVLQVMSFVWSKLTASFVRGIAGAFSVACYSLPFS